MKYDNWEDAHLYLHGTYIKVRGEPMYVRRVENDEEVKCMTLDGNLRSVPLEDIDFTPFSLGYAYHEPSGKPYYMERKPKRGWRQGVGPDNGIGRDT